MMKKTTCSSAPSLVFLNMAPSRNIVFYDTKATFPLFLFRPTVIGLTKSELRQKIHEKITNEKDPYKWNDGHLGLYVYSFKDQEASII